MDKFPKDMLIQVALDLDMVHIIKFCKTNKRVNSAVCENENFWRQKLLKDYPNHFQLSQVQESYRKKYLRISSFYQSVDEGCQAFLDHFFGESQRYINKAEYLKDFKRDCIEMYISRQKLNDEEFSDYFSDFRYNHRKLYPAIINNVHSRRVRDDIWDSTDDPRNFIANVIDFFILDPQSIEI
jgi:hypothetical protein